MRKRNKLPKMGPSGKLSEFAANKGAGGAKSDGDVMPDAPAKPEMKRLSLALNRDAWLQLRMLGLEQDKSGQTLLTEAVNLLFMEHAKPPVA